MSDVYVPSVGDALAVNGRFTATPIRDFGMLESALARPLASAFGQDAYPDVWSKAAALLHSITANHPFIDGNKRTALGLAVMLLAGNGVEFGRVDEDALFDLVMEIARGKVEEVEHIAASLQEALGAA